jgi:hypothetical protein
MRRKSIQGLAFRTVSQTGIHYRESPLSESPGGLPYRAPHAGDRFPWTMLRFEAGGVVEDSFKKLDDARFNLLALGQPSPTADALGFGDLLRVHAIPSDPGNDAELARVHVPRPSFYLLRPDGHVGLCGTRLDAGAVRKYAAERLRVGGPAAPSR